MGLLFDLYGREGKSWIGTIELASDGLNFINKTVQNGVDTPDLLSTEEFRGFWVFTKLTSDNKVHIEVGRANETKAFMSGTTETAMTWSWVTLKQLATVATYRNFRPEAHSSCR